MTLFYVTYSVKGFENPKVRVWQPLLVQDFIIVICSLQFKWKQNDANAI